LALLSMPLTARILVQLGDGPLRLADLHSDSGSAPQSTVRARLKRMAADGLVIKQGRDGSPGVAEFALTAAGHDLLPVMDALEQWLLLAPAEALDFDSAGGNAAIVALEGGWSSTILSALAGDAHSLGSLAADIGGLGYPSLHRRLKAMLQVGQIDVCPGEGQSTFYEVTEWLQQSSASLAAAVRWEQTHFPETTASMTRLDTEASFLLTLPLLRVEVALKGSCRMSVEINDEEGRLCGVVSQIAQGKVVSSVTGADDIADSWVTGSIPAWGRAMVEDGTDHLELGGEKRLPLALLGGLHIVLFGI
jgi:DNA-binding HxlR family transcriptional regulator